MSSTRSDALLYFDILESIDTAGNISNRIRMKLLQRIRWSI